MRTALLAVAVLAAVAAIVPATASAAAVRGVVVARSHGTLLVATSSGRVVAVRARAPIGARMVGLEVVGRAGRATIHGVVVATKGSTLFVASNHHLVAIRTGRALAGTATGAADTPGTIVTSTVGVHPNGQLDEENETEDGQDTANTIQVQATVAAVGQGTITLTVNGQNVTVDLPAGLTLPQSLVGQTVTVNVSLSQDDQGDDNSGDGGGSGDGGSGGDGGGD